MDSGPPFAADDARLGLLYRLPLTGSERDILVIALDAETAAVIGRAQAGLELHRVAPGEPAPAKAFDVVVLPGSLTAAAGEAGPPPTRPPATLLAEAFAAVRPGGVVVGHLDHLSALRTLGRLLRERGLVRRWMAHRGVISGRGCRQSLLRCGFVEPECFYVEPRIGSPLALVPIHRQAARLHFLRAVRRTRREYHPAGYALRLAMAAMGLGGLLQPHLFFWARRPC